MNILKLVDVGAYLAIAVYLGLHWQSDARHIIGAAISVPAFFLWVLSRRQLGESFTVRAEAHALVTTGLYSRIRNPIYFFGFIAFVGVLVAAGWYIGLAVFALFNAGQFFRMKREEQVLTQAFGQQYLDYKGKTWF